MQSYENRKNRARLPLFTVVFRNSYEEYGRECETDKDENSKGGEKESGSLCPGEFLRHVALIPFI
jgi:hypothetical protein